MCCQKNFENEHECKCKKDGKPVCCGDGKKCHCQDDEGKIVQLTKDEEKGDDENANGELCLL